MGIGELGRDRKGAAWGLRGGSWVCVHAVLELAAGESGEVSLLDMPQLSWNCIGRS